MVLAFLRRLWESGTPELYVSYHHAADRAYFQQLAERLAPAYTLRHGDYPGRAEGEVEPRGFVRRLRRDLGPCQCTLVLCGRETHLRRCVDWEIKASLDRERALIGVILPSALIEQGRPVVPARLVDNDESDYAVIMDWKDLLPGPKALAPQIIEARNRQSYLIANDRPLMTRNL